MNHYGDIWKMKKLMILIIKLSVILFKNKYDVRMNTAIDRVGECHFRIRVWSLFSIDIKIFIYSFVLSFSLSFFLLILFGFKIGTRIGQATILMT